VRTLINDKEIVRFYSPISRPDDLGHIDLLIKVDDNGVMSHKLDNLRPGDTLEFKGPMGGIQLNHTILKHDKITKIGLIAGGVGIAPIIQIVRAAFHIKADHLKLKLVYGAIEESELIFFDTLLQKEKEHSNFNVYFTLDHPPQGWSRGVGFITSEVIKRELFPPGDDVQIIICGPPKMCSIMKSNLEECGYTKDMYYSFI